MAITHSLATQIIKNCCEADLNATAPDPDEDVISLANAVEIIKLWSRNNDDAKQACNLLGFENAGRAYKAFWDKLSPVAIEEEWGSLEENK